jgi:ADP-heptose:LPS heptosyltransferase
MTHRLSFNPYLHTSQTFRILVEALDQPPAQFPCFGLVPPPAQAAETLFVPNHAEVVEVRALLGELAQGPLILLNANCSDLMPLRRWSGDRYVALARGLLNRYPEVGIGFTGAPSEARTVEELVLQVGSPRCVSLAGRTTLRQLMILYGLAEVLVTNDSGPAHFATLTPTEVVVLFGPETPALFAARSPRTHPLWAGLACSPCINAFNDRSSTCRDNVCMQQITVEQVLTAVSAHYEARLNGSRRPLPLVA